MNEMQIKQRQEKEWILRVSAEEVRKSEAVKAIADALDLTSVTAQLLVNRGCETPVQAESFLMKREELFHDPFLLMDMEAAAKTVLRAVENKEKIAVFGDYDVDGVTSVSILCMYLRSLGAEVSYYIPSRLREGYGMSEAAIRKLSEDGITTIVTVDTGITAVEEAKVAKELGITLVITDHHECHGDLPDAVAVVNPHRPDDTYPFKELAGVGVVFKLLCAMESCRRPEAPLGECVRTVGLAYADLVALGTIADVMPIRDENRLIVALGIRQIESSPRVAVSALLDAATGEGKSKSPRKITSSVIGFTLAPRINAAGRIREADIAVELFLEKDPETAATLAHRLCDINRERQNEENKIVDVAYARIDAEHNFETDPVIVLDDAHWHHGVIGIVSSRITECYGRPSILISFEKEGTDEMERPEDAGKGSGRSVKGLNLVEALASCSDILEKFGGHELAAGLTVRRENLPLLKERLNEYARKAFKEGIPPVTVEADCELLSEDLTMRQAEELYALEPFGVSNPVPLFLTRDMTVSDVTTVGAGKHIRFKLKKDGTEVTAMYFRHGLSDIDVYPGDRIDVLYNLDVNEFQGRKSLQMIVKDIRLSEEILEREEAQKTLYQRVFAALESDTAPDPADVKAILPDRSECGTVYNTLKKELYLGHEVFSLRALSHLLRTTEKPVSYGKLRCILDIFSELRLLQVELLDAEREIYAFKYIYMQGKTSLDRSDLLKTLRQAASGAEGA